MTSRVLIAALFALGAAAFTSAAAPPVNPCSLLTQAQANEVLGVTASPAQGGGKLCRWSEPGGATLKKMIVVTIHDAQAFAFAKKPSTSPALVKTPATGIGDDAVYNTTGGTSTLTVKKGDNYFEVHVYGFSDADTKAKEKTVALHVIAKLPS